MSYEKLVRLVERFVEDEETRVWANKRGVLNLTKGNDHVMGVRVGEEVADAMASELLACRVCGCGLEEALARVTLVGLASGLPLEYAERVLRELVRLAGLG
ncbi:hypothetical protein [Methanopyrus kandleri]